MGWYLLRKPHPQLENGDSDVINILKNDILLGRGKDCTVHCLSMYVSRHHVRLIPNDDGSFCLMDLGSSNGTFLNQKKVQPHEKVPVSLGDEIGIGHTVPADKDCFVYVVMCTEGKSEVKSVKGEQGGSESNLLKTEPATHEVMQEKPQPTNHLEPVLESVTEHPKQLETAEAAASEQLKHSSRGLKRFKIDPEVVTLDDDQDKQDSSSKRPKVEETAHSESESKAAVVKSRTKLGTESGQKLELPPCPAPIPLRKSMDGFPRLSDRRLSALIKECNDDSASTIKLNSSSLDSKCATSPLSAPFKAGSSSEAKPLLTSTPNVKIKVEPSAGLSSLKTYNNCSPISNAGSRNSMLSSSHNYTLDEEIIPIDLTVEENDDMSFPCSQMFADEDIKPVVAELNKDMDLVDLVDPEENFQREEEEVVIISSDEEEEEIEEANRWFERLSQSVGKKEKEEECKPVESEKLSDKEWELELEELQQLQNDKKAEEEPVIDTIDIPDEKVKKEKERSSKHKKKEDKEKKEKPQKEGPSKGKVSHHRSHRDKKKKDRGHQDHKKQGSHHKNLSSTKRLKEVFHSDSESDIPDDMNDVTTSYPTLETRGDSDSSFDEIFKSKSPDEKFTKKFTIDLQRVEEIPKICEKYGLLPPTTSSPVSHSSVKKPQRKIELVEALPNPPRRAINRGISGPSAQKIFDGSLSSKSTGMDQPKDPKSVRRERLAEVAARSVAEKRSSAEGRKVAAAPAKVKVTSANRGSFLVDNDVRQISKPRSRVDVIKNIKIPKLQDKDKASNNLPLKSPLQAMNMSWEKHKIADKVPCILEKDKEPLVELPTGPQPKKRIAAVPPPGFYDTVKTTLPAVLPVKSCLSGSSKHNIAQNTERNTKASKKRVKFKENMVEIRYIDKLPGTRPLGSSKDADKPKPFSLNKPAIKIPKGPMPNDEIILQEVLFDIAKWNPIWLKEEKNLPADVLPPVAPNMNLPAVPRTEFVDFNEYHDTWYPLLMLDLWAGVSRSFNSNSNDSRTMFMAVDSASSVPMAKRPDKMLSSLHCHMLVEQGNNCYPKRGNLIIADIVFKEPSGRSAAVPVFAYVSYEWKDRLSPTVQFHKELLTKVPNPAFKVRFMLLTREKKNCVLVLERPMLIKNVKYIRGDLRVFQAMKNLEYMPLQYSIISPSSANEDFTLPDVSKKSLTSSCSQELLNPSQTKVVLQTAEVCLEKKPKICLIQGPPGTGKSQTIVNLVLQLLYRDNIYSRKNRERGLVPKILLCAPSNNAVDLLVRRLLSKRQTLDQSQRFKMVRVGQQDYIHKDVESISLQKLAQADIRAQNQVSSIETEIRSREAKLKAIENSIQGASSNNRPVSQDLTFRQADLTRQIKVLEERLKQNEGGRLRSTNQESAIERETKKKILRGADIVASTLSSCLINVMEAVFPTPREEQRYHFQVCIVDEATQCLEVETLIPLLLSVKTLVLVGDSNQLPATILSKVAREKGLGTSLFSRLQQTVPSAVQLLDTQYRMHPEILRWPNYYFYNQYLKSPEMLRERRDSKVLPYTVLSHHYQQDPTREINYDEAKFVVQLAELMIEEKVVKYHDFKLGIITPYQSQKQLLLKLLFDKKKKKVTDLVEINTIDGFQGQEKDLIILSCVRTNGVGFLADRQRVNVALTRAKYALFICGNFSALDRDSMWNNLLSDARQRKCFLTLDSNLSLQNTAKLWNLICKKQHRKQRT